MFLLRLWMIASKEEKNEGELHVLIGCWRTGWSLSCVAPSKGASETKAADLKFTWYRFVFWNSSGSIVKTLSRFLLISYRESSVVVSLKWKPQNVRFGQDRSFPYDQLPRNLWLTGGDSTWEQMVSLAICTSAN